MDNTKDGLSKFSETALFNIKGTHSPSSKNTHVLKSRVQQVNEALSESLWQDRLKREAYINWREEFDFVLQDNLRLTMVILVILSKVINELLGSENNSRFGC